MCDLTQNMLPRTEAVASVLSCCPIGPASSDAIMRVVRELEQLHDGGR